MTAIPVNIDASKQNPAFTGSSALRVQLMQSKHMHTMDFYLQLICAKYVANLPAQQERGQFPRVSKLRTTRISCTLSWTLLGDARSVTISCALHASFWTCTTRTLCFLLLCSACGLDRIRRIMTSHINLSESIKYSLIRSVFHHERQYNPD